MKLTYSRNGKSNLEKREVLPEAPVVDPGNEGKIKVNGFQQVIDMMRVADDEFRSSLLSRLAKQHPKLYYEIKKELKKHDL